MTDWIRVRRERRIKHLTELLETDNHDSETTYLKPIHLKDGRRAHLILSLKVDTEEEHREYLEHKREIMEMDEQSAAREAAKEASTE